MKLAVLTNGRAWWPYLPLQAGNWEQRRFLTIDLEVQEPNVVERRFMEYLSPESVDSGQAVRDAEDLVESQKRDEIVGKALSAAWTQIVETPDDLLFELISKATPRICGLKPEPAMVEQFLAGRARALTEAPEGSPPLVVSREIDAPAARRTHREGAGPSFQSPWILRTPQTSGTLCCGVRKRGLKSRTAMAAGRFAAGMPHA